MPCFYSAFRLSLHADCAIPWLAPTAQPGSIDARVWLNTAFPTGIGSSAGEPWYVSACEEEGAPVLRAWRLTDGR